MDRPGQDAQLALQAVTTDHGLRIMRQSLHGGQQMNDETPRQADRVPLGCEAEFRRHGDSRYPVELITLAG